MVSRTLLNNIVKAAALAALMFVVIPAEAQDTRESIVYLNGGGYIGSHNNIGAYMGLEYDRQLKGNWYWGARLSGTYYLGSPTKYDPIRHTGMIAQERRPEI